MPRAWRIVKSRHAATAFTGEGAAKFGGRWNSRGFPVVYTSSSRALAALELLVHLTPPVPFTFTVFSVDFDADLVEILPASALPPDWNREPPPVATQALGDAWVREAGSPVLQVPSVLIPQEANYLLNPTHPSFRTVQIGPGEPFAFDPRLLG